MPFRLAAGYVFADPAFNRSVSHPEEKPRSAEEPRLTVVLPAYRAAHCVADTVAKLRTELPDAMLGKVETSSRGGRHSDEVIGGVSGGRHSDEMIGGVGLEIVVVDDGSDDRTAEVAQTVGADVVLKLPKNLGKGAAVRAGMLIASGRVVAFTDVDLAYRPCQIAKLLFEVESGVDIAVGNRHHPDSVELNRRAVMRPVGSRFVSMLHRLLGLSNCQDTQCGLKVFSHEAAQRLFKASVIDRFAFDIELFYLARCYGLHLKEVPVKVVYSPESTVRVLHDGLILARDMLRIRARAVLGRYPG